MQLVHPWVGNSIRVPDYSFIVEMDLTTLDAMTIMKKWLDNLALLKKFKTKSGITLGQELGQELSNYYLLPLIRKFLDCGMLICCLNDEKTALNLFMREKDKLTEIGCVSKKAAKYFLPIINAGGTLSVGLHAFIDFDASCILHDSSLWFLQQDILYLEFFGEDLFPLHGEKYTIEEPFIIEYGTDSRKDAENTGWRDSWLDEPRIECYIDGTSNLKKVDKILLRVNIGTDSCLEDLDDTLLDEMNDYLFSVKFVKKLRNEIIDDEDYSLADCNNDYFEYIERYGDESYDDD